MGRTSKADQRVRPRLRPRAGPVLPTRWAVVVQPVATPGLAGDRRGPRRPRGSSTQSFWCRTRPSAATFSTGSPQSCSSLRCGPTGTCSSSPQLKASSRGWLGEVFRRLLSEQQHIGRTRPAHAAGRLVQQSAERQSAGGGARELKAPPNSGSSTGNGSTVCSPTPVWWSTRSTCRALEREVRGAVPDVYQPERCATTV